MRCRILETQKVKYHIDNSRYINFHFNLKDTQIKDIAQPPFFFFKEKQNKKGGD